MTPYFFFDNRNELTDWFLSNLKNISSQQLVYIVTNSSPPSNLVNKSNLKFISTTDLDYEKDFNRFKHVYKHMSTHDESFELSCFERYFALRSLMEKFEIDSIWHLDTDVIPAPTLDSYSNSKLVFSSPYADLSVVSGHSSKFAMDGLNLFVQFLLEDFYQKNYLELLESYQIRIKSGLLGGVTDMSAIAYWLRTIPATMWSNSYSRVRNGFSINHTFSNLTKEISALSRTFGSFVLLTRFKKRIFVVSFFNITELASLHFQGQYKVLMRPFLNCRFLIGTHYFIFLQTRVLMKIKIIYNRVKKRFSFKS